MAKNKRGTMDRRQQQLDEKQLKKILFRTPGIARWEETPAEEDLSQPYPYGLKDSRSGGNASDDLSAMYAELE